MDVDANCGSASSHRFIFRSHGGGYVIRIAIFGYEHRQFICLMNSGQFCIIEPPTAATTNHADAGAVAARRLPLLLPVPLLLLLLVLVAMLL